MTDRPYIDHDARIRAAKAYGKLHGARGNGGGWISQDGRTVAQGWFNYGSIYARPIADWLTRELTAFDSFDALCNDTAPSYRPTILPRTWRERHLADAYDVRMHFRGDSRRAWRGTNA